MNMNSRKSCLILLVKFEKAFDSHGSLSMKFYPNFILAPRFQKKVKIKRVLLNCHFSEPCQHHKGRTQRDLTMTYTNIYIFFIPYAFIQPTCAVNKHTMQYNTTTKIIDLAAVDFPSRNNCGSQNQVLSTIAHN